VTAVWMVAVLLLLRKVRCGESPSLALGLSLLSIRRDIHRDHRERTNQYRISTS